MIAYALDVRAGYVSVLNLRKTLHFNINSGLFPRRL